MDKLDVPTNTPPELSNAQNVVNPLHRREGFDRLFRLLEGWQAWLTRHFPDGRHLTLDLCRQGKQALLFRGSIFSRDQSIQFVEEPTWLRIRIPSRLDSDVLCGNPKTWENLLRSTRHCLVDLTRCHSMANAAVEHLNQLSRTLNSRGCLLVLLAGGTRARKLVASMGLAENFLVVHDIMEARCQIQKGWPASLSVVWDPIEQSLLWQGEITAANVARAWRMTRQQVRTLQPLPQSVRIDLSALHFIDNTGLGLMIRLCKFARKLGITIQFTRPQYSVLRVIQLARLESHLLSPSKNSCQNEIESA